MIDDEFVPVLKASKAINIYHRPIDGQDVPRLEAGCFACEDCIAPPMSANSKYYTITAFQSNRADRVRSARNIPIFSMIVCYSDKWWQKALQQDQSLLTMFYYDRGYASQLDVGRISLKDLKNKNLYSPYVRQFMYTRNAIKFFPDLVEKELGSSKMHHINRKVDLTDLFTYLVSTNHPILQIHQPSMPIGGAYENPGPEFKGLQSPYQAKEFKDLFFASPDRDPEAAYASLFAARIGKLKSPRFGGFERLEV